MKKYIFIIILLNFTTFNTKLYAQSIEGCNEIAIIDGVPTIHGIYHLHLECEDDILITSYLEDQNGTIIDGFLDSPEIQIIPGDSFVRIIPESARNPLKHKTRIGNGGIGTRQVFVNNNTISTINIHPNPTKNKITINAKQKIKKIEVYNSYGIEQTISQNKTQDNSTILYLENYKKGLYILKVHLKNNQIITKIIIKN